MEIENQIARLQAGKFKELPTGDLTSTHVKCAQEDVNLVQSISDKSSKEHVCVSTLLLRLN